MDRFQELRAQVRNRITHDYFNLHLEIIGEIVQDDLPPLQQQVRELLSQE